MKCVKVSGLIPFDINDGINEFKSEYDGTPQDFQKSTPCGVLRQCALRKEVNISSYI